MKKGICHDCQAEEGKLHDLGCDMERCPLCGNQLVSCPCKYALFGYKYDFQSEYCGLPKEVYENDLSKDQKKAWEKSLEGIRVPFIQYPNICMKCGKLWPDMFHVSDQGWRHYIEIGERDKIICLDCYAFIKECIDSNVKE